MHIHPETYSHKFQKKDNDDFFEHLTYILLLLKLTMNSKSLCLNIIGLDDAIRFAGIASMNNSKILAAEYRKDLFPLLTATESELSIMQSLIRMSIRKTLEQRLGRIIYATAVYEKVKRSTISMRNRKNNNNSNNTNREALVRKGQPENKDKGNEDTFLMVSFEKEADHDAIITKKILPFLNSMGRDLAMAG
jgi:hypothetical protein